MRNYLTEFMNELEFDSEAQKTISDTYIRVESDMKISGIIENLLNEYKKDTIDWNKSMELIISEAERINIHSYTLRLLFFMCMTKHAVELYKSRGLDYQLFKDTFMDFRYKLDECRNQYGICGTSCGMDWYEKFFKLERFALGRLQFDIVPFGGEKPYTSDGITINPGEPVLTTHIPSGSPLKPELVEDSFARAHEFFKGKFKNGVTPIACTSWLLYPRHYEMLGENSNIVKFMDQYDIVLSGNFQGYPMFITIFNKPYDKDLTIFQCDTSLQRAYLKLAREKKPSGYGVGIMLYKD